MRPLKSSIVRFAYAIRSSAARASPAAAAIVPSSSWTRDRAASRAASRFCDSPSRLASSTAASSSRERTSAIDASRPSRSETTDLQRKTASRTFFLRISSPSSR